MRIGELAKQSDVPASTIRFYEGKGLMSSAKRGANGYRYYDDAALQRLNLIQFAQRLGFSLEEMLAMFKAKAGWDHEEIMIRVDTRLTEVDALLKRLTEQKKEIKNLKNRLQDNWQQGSCMQTEEMQQIIASTLL